VNDLEDRTKKFYLLRQELEQIVDFIMEGGE